MRDRRFPAVKSLRNFHIDDLIGWRRRHVNARTYEGHRQEIRDPRRIEDRFATVKCRLDKVRVMMGAPLRLSALAGTALRRPRQRHDSKMPSVVVRRTSKQHLDSATTASH
jgi:hypothetical protein